MAAFNNLREIICALTAEHEWLVRRGPGIGSHTGRRVRDGHLNGGPEPLEKEIHEILGSKCED